MEKIKPLVNLEELATLDVKKAKEEFHLQFDELMKAREELFEKRLQHGLDEHKKFLKECFTTN